MYTRDLKNHVIYISKGEAAPVRAMKEDTDKVIPGSLSTWGEGLQYPLNSRLGLHHRWSGQWERDKFLVPCQELSDSLVVESSCYTPCNIPAA
jgi:hypothetical protein